MADLPQESSEPADLSQEPSEPADLPQGTSEQAAAPTTTSEAPPKELFELVNASARKPVRLLHDLFDLNDATTQMPIALDTLGTSDSNSGRSDGDSGTTDILLVTLHEHLTPYNLPGRLSTQTLAIKCQITLDGEPLLTGDMELCICLANLLTTPAARLLLFPTDTSSPLTIDILFADSSPDAYDGIKMLTPLVGLFPAHEEHCLDGLAFRFGRTSIEGRNTVPNISSAKRALIERMCIKLSQGTRQTIRIVFEEAEVYGRQEMHKMLYWIQHKTILPCLTSDNAPGEWLLDEVLNREKSHDILPLQQAITRGFPFIPLPASNVFSTAKQYAIELGLSSYFQCTEVRLGQRAFSKITHKAKVTIAPHTKKIQVLVKYTSFDPLGAIKHRGLVPRMEGKPVHIVVAGKELAAITIRKPAGVKYYDAALQIMQATSNLGPWVKEVRIRPHEAGHTFSCQLRTTHAILWSQDDSKWITTLLNKQIPQPEYILSDLQQTDIDSAREWLRTIVDWNDEQLAVLTSIDHVNGGISILIGAGGTGKTHVQAAMAVFFVLCGLHVMIVAPTHNNVNSFITRLKEWRSLNKINGVRFADIGVASMTASPTTMSQGQMNFHHLGHEQDMSLGVREFIFALAELKDNGGHLPGGEQLENSCNVVHQVISWLHKAKTERDTEFPPVPGYQDAWTFLTTAEFLYNAGTKWEQRPDQHPYPSYDAAFQTCKQMVIAKTQLMIVTARNACCREVHDQFARPATSKGTVMIFDEAFKECEVNVIGPLFAEKDVRAVFLSGDTEQLSPLNQSSQTSPVFNPYNARINLSLPSRLIAEGFPYKELKQQERMHPQLAASIQPLIYGHHPTVRDSRNVALDVKYPGLHAVLSDCLSEAIDDGSIRLQWLQVDGTRRYANDGSAMVAQHIDCMIDVLLPLRKYFTAHPELSFQKNVLVVCAYAWTARELRQALEKTFPSETQWPRIETLNKSQGIEADIVLMDLSASQRNQLGFMQHRNRVVTALTRAREVLWIVGGKMGYRGTKRYDDQSMPLLGQFYDQLEGTGHVSTPKGYEDSA